MAITEQQVIKAAERIAERGERPTNPRIRAELGEGSYSTINKYMQDWRAAQQEPEAPEPEPELLKEPEVPEAITAQAQQAAVALVTAAWRESDNRHAEAVEAERHALQSEFDKLRAERQRHDAEIEELNDALVRLEAQGEEAVAVEVTKIEAVRGELSEAKQQHSATREELAAVKARQQTAQERIAELRQELETARKQATESEHRERRQVASAAEHARQQDAEIAQLRRELEAAQAATAQAQKALDTQQQNHERELEEWHKEVDAVRTALAASDATQRAATDAVTQLQERVSGLEARLVDAHGTIERLTSRDKSAQRAEEQPNLPFDQK